jgi:hypothetical protein
MCGLCGLSISLFLGSIVNNVEALSTLSPVKKL